MATLLNSVSPFVNQSPETTRKGCGFFSQIPNLHTFSLNRGFSRVLASTQITISPKDTVVTLPNWRSGKSDSRSRELRLNDAFLHLEFMVGKGQKPDVAQATQLLYDLCKANKMRKSIRVMEMMITSGIIPDAASYTFLVNYLCRRGNVGGLCMHGDLNQSLQLLDRLMLKGLIPNAFTYSFLLEAAYKEKGVNEAVKLLDEIIAKGGKPNLWEEANELLAEMDGEDRSPSIVTYNILIGSLALHGRIEHALEVLDEMMRRRFKPTAASYNPIIARLCTEGKVDVVVKCLDQMIYRQCTPNEGTYNAIGVLCEEGMVQEAFSIFQSLGNKQNSSMHDFYRSVITSLCRKGNTYPAFQLLYEITKHGFTPDSYTYSSLIRGLYLSFEIFEMMIEKGYMPNETTYTILVEGIAHEKDNQLAAKVLKELHLRQVVSQSTVERLVMQYDLEGLPVEIT
ncbi:hypothetical protein SLA2020_284390 [Shorea laevis]